MLQKIENTFSSTKKFNDYIRRDEERLGFNEVLSGLIPEDINGTPLDVNNSSLWRFISGSCEDVGNKVYERINRCITNIRDIDTCELYPLYSIAMELGYDGDLRFLTYQYPKEIYELLSILSVNKDTVLNTPKILNALQRSTLFSTLSADPTSSTSFPVMSGYTDSIVDSPTSAIAYTAEEWTQIQALSATGYLTEDYNFIPDTNYVTYIDTAFTECISSFVYLKYRYEELYGIDNLVETSGYIWQHITDQLDESLLYLTQQNKDRSIIDLKLRLNVPLSFNEIIAIDEINFGRKLLSEFTQSEQLVIAAEIDRRDAERKTIPNIQRWKVERERKVVEYFRFIENFNQIDEDIYFTQYKLDPSLIELSGTQSSSFLFVSSCVFHLDDSYIIACAQALRNIALKISYLRQHLKTLSQRYTLKGTSQLIEIMVEELFKRYLFNPSDWRYISGTTSNLRTISAELDPEFEAKVIEYFDTSNYYNISALPYYSPEKFSESDSAVTQPYWLNDEITNPSVESSYIKSSEISGFYRDQLGIEFNVPSELSGVSGYGNFLENFLSRVFAGAALSAYNTVSACSFNYISSQKFINGIISSAILTDSDEEITFFNNYTLSGDVTYPDDLKVHMRGSAYFDIVTAVVSTTTPIYQHLSGGSIFLQPNLSNQIVFSNYSPTGIYYTSGRPRTSTYFNAYDLSGDVDNLLFYTVTNQDGDSDKVVSGTIVGNIFSEADEIPVPSGISAIFLAYAPSGYENESVDPNSDVFYRYTGLSSGLTPYYNWKNLTHPSIAVHPFLKGLIEIGLDFNRSIQRLLIQLVGTVEYDFDNLIYRINEYGNTVQSWRSINNELIHYSTYYEANTNFNNDGIVSKNIGIDGPWNIEALQYFLNDPVNFITEVSSGINQYYQGIGLTLSEQQNIAYQLGSVSGDESEGLNSIRGLKNKRIHQFAVDNEENNYILFKDDVNFDITGRIWMRYANHPLALPFSSLSGMRLTTGECGETSMFSQIDTAGHRQFSNGPNAALDFGIVGNWIWLAYGNNLQPNVIFGQIIPDAPYSRIIRDFYHNYEGLSLGGTGRTYVGNYVQQGVFHTVSILAEPSAYCALPYDPITQRYLASIYFDVFDPDSGTSFFTRNISVAYDTVAPYLIHYELSGGGYYILPGGGYYYLPGSEFGPDWGSGGYRNMFRIGKGKESVAIGFDAVIPLTGNYPVSNVFGDSCYNEYRNLFQCSETVSATNIPVRYPDTGVTLIQFEQETNSSELGSEATTLYNMPFSRLGFVGIFPEPSAVNNFNTLFRTDYQIPPIDYFYIELFTDITPSAFTPYRRGRFSIDDQEYICFINFDKYLGYENIPFDLNYLEDAKGLELDEDESRSLEQIESTSAYSEFVIAPIFNSSLSAINLIPGTFFEFDNETIGKTLSGITEDGKFVHMFKYAGRSGFLVSSMPI